MAHSTPDNPVIGLTVTLPDGPWAGVEVTVVGMDYRPFKGTPIPVAWFALQRPDTREIGWVSIFRLVKLLPKKETP